MCIQLLMSSKEANDGTRKGHIDENFLEGLDFFPKNLTHQNVQIYVGGESKVLMPQR